MKVREAIRVDPFMVKERVKLGQFFLMDGKYADAEKMLSSAIDFDGTYPKAYKLLGDTYLRLNDLQKALAAYTKFLEYNKVKSSMDVRQVKHNIKQITIPKARVR